MKQSRAMSLLEAIANVIVGYGVAVLTQILIFPLFGIEAALGEHLAIGLALRRSLPPSSPFFFLPPLFYEFSIEEFVPADHPLRAIDQFLDLTDVRPLLAPILQRKRTTID